MRMWDGMALGGLGWLVAILWVVFAVALLVLVVLAVVWLAKAVGSNEPRSRPEHGSAREALDLRYARGEIGRDAYLQARRDLGEP